MTPPLPDWQLPPGVTRGLWDYLHDAQVARTYDESLAHSPLFSVDQGFAREHFDRPGRLIDLGCGTGRLALAFAQRGFWVVAVDLSEEMLKTAAARTAQAGVAVHLLKANLVELDGVCDRTFDYAACLFSTLGMVTGAEHRRRMVEHVYRLLRPGGTFILHVHNRWFNCWDPQGRTWLLYDLLGLLTGRCGGDRTMPVHQGIAGLTLHLFGRREAMRLLRAAGFQLLEVRPLSSRSDGRLRWPGWFGWLRSYGYLLAVRKPAE